MDTEIAQYVWIKLVKAISPPAFAEPDATFSYRVTADDVSLAATTRAAPRPTGSSSPPNSLAKIGQMLSMVQALSSSLDSGGKEPPAAPKAVKSELRSLAMTLMSMASEIASGPKEPPGGDDPTIWQIDAAKIPTMLRLAKKSAPPLSGGKEPPAGPSKSLPARIDLEALQQTIARVQSQYGSAGKPDVTERQASTRADRNREQGGTWLIKLDREFDGMRGRNTRVELSRVFVGRRAAIEWLLSQKGGLWLEDAVDYFLISATDVSSANP